MAGPLPAGLFDLVNLQVLELSGNSFSGSLSVNFANFSNVTHIQLSNNTFTGTIPDVFQGLEFLSKLIDLFRVPVKFGLTHIAIAGNLELHRNGFTGEISAGLCNRTGDSFFDINYLTADCLGSSPEVLCSCCSECF